MTITDSRPTGSDATPNTLPSGGERLAGGQVIPDTQIPRAAGTELTTGDTQPRLAVGASSRSAKVDAAPILRALSGEQPVDRQRNGGAPSTTAISNQPAGGRISRDIQADPAAGSSSRSARRVATPIDPPPGGEQPTDCHVHGAAHVHDAVGVEAGRDPAATGVPEPNAVTLLDPALALAADVLDDIERVRIANANRLLILTRSVEDSDGEVRGFGLDESHPDVARLAAMVELLAKAEHDAELNLGRMMRRHPLHTWIKAQRGIGDKQGARLLAAIGDPYINSSTGMPRTVSALWAYCGLHVLPAGQAACDTHIVTAGRSQLPVDREGCDTRNSYVGGVGGDPGQPPDDTHRPVAGVAPKRARGQRANWSTRAKTKAYLVATSCMKQLVAPCARDGDGPAAHVDACSCSAYRVVYDARRAHTKVTHPDWSDGHSHNDALRIAAKAVLRDLWRAAREFHNGPDEG